ncbi:MAG: hypothetical protein ABJC98_20470 [Bacteroidota bacterium]
MSTIIFLVIVVTEVVIRALIYIGMKNKVIRDAKLKYLQLSELGSRHNLSFSSHEIVGGKMIGVDGVKRKLLILEKNNEINQINIISLDEVSAISVKTIYNSINSGELKKRKMHEFLKSILLQFDFKDAREKIGLPFYQNEINNTGDLPGLERKVKNWQVMLSKMIGQQNNKLFQDKRELSLAG